MGTHQVRFPGGDGGVFNVSEIGKDGENTHRFSSHAGRSGAQLVGFGAVLDSVINFVMLISVLFNEHCPRKEHE